MDNIKLAVMLCKIFECVYLVKLKRVSRLWVFINAHNFKVCTEITHTCPTSATKQIEQLWFQRKCLTA